MADLEDVTLDGRPLQSLRVADLKAALEERGLSKSGQKNALVKRLKGALMLENLQRTSTANIGLQPNSQIGEEMSQNSFIKQYLAKQQELLRQRLEREAREAYDTNEPEDHTEVNNSTSCPPQAQEATPGLAEQHKPPGPSGVDNLFSAVNKEEGNRNQEAEMPGPPASGSMAVGVPDGEHRPEKGSASKEAPSDSDDDDSEDGEEDGGDDDDWESGTRRRSHREPARAPTTRERSGAPCQPPQQHMPSLLSPQLRQPTPPPSPPPELSFPLPDTPKQSPPSPDVAQARRSSSTSSSGSSSSGSRSSSPEPQRSGHAERKPGPLTLLARKMESEGAFSGAGWHHASGAGERQDGSSLATSFPGRGPPEGLVSAITHTANTAGHVSFPTIPGINQGIPGAHSAHIQLPVGVRKATATEERHSEIERERALELERQRKLEQERAMEEERERADVLEREERQRALDQERMERQQALEREEREKALQRERELTLERERQDREVALAREREERERALAQEMEIERQKELERQRALEQERQERERREREEMERARALEQERKERERALEQERLQRERALEAERKEKERIEREKALEQERLERERLERQRALDQERLEREKAFEQQRVEMERALEKERLEREKALERERLEREKALEQERMERERALEQEKLKQERALEQQRLELERKEKERIEREKSLERERIEKEKALEREREEKERLAREAAQKEERERALQQEKLEREEKERALEQERLEKEKAMQKEKEEMEAERARMAERESHLPPSKRGRDIGLTSLSTPLPLSAVPGRKSSTKGGEQEDDHASKSRVEADEHSATTSPTPPVPQSSFRKFRFSRDSPIQLQSSSPSMVIKRPRNFSDTPQPQASPGSSLTDSAKSHEEGLQSSTEQEGPEKVTKQEVTGHVGGTPEEETTLAPVSEKDGAKGSVSEDKEKEYTRKVDESHATNPLDSAQRRGRDAKKEEKQARQRSTSNDSSSSESDSGSSSSGSSGSSSSSQEKTISTTRGRREGEPDRDISPQHQMTRHAKAEGLKETHTASPCKRDPPVEKSKAAADGDTPTKKTIMDAPTREESQRKRTNKEEEMDKKRQVKETAMAEAEKLPETNEETPKAFSARKISISSSKMSPGTGSAEVEQDAGAAAGRKRRWGSSTAVTAKKPSISITTDSLKSLIPDIRQSLGQEAVVDLDPEQAVLSGPEDEEKERADQDLQIQRTVTQVVHLESQENGEKETKKSRHEDSEEEDPQGDGERTGAPSDKMDTSFPGAMETQSPSHTSHDVESNTVTPSDTFIRRSISQQKTGVSITIDDPVRSARKPSPPRGKVSNIVHISNLVRPFTLGQLKELLSRTGTLLEEGFWIDKIKSHCFVTYCSPEEAVATRASLHGVKWPQSNPKVLRVDFCQKDELDFHKGLADRPAAEDQGPGAARGRPPGLPSLLPERDQWAEREREMERREKGRAEREWDRDKVREFGKPGEEKEGGPPRSHSRERRRKERGKSKEKKTEKKEKPAEDPPAKLLDDLFRKTKAAPCIYWLPLTDEEFVQREAARADRMKEREKRRKEQDEEKEKKREEERKERMKAGGVPTGERSEGEKDRDRERDRDRGRDRERENDKRRDGYRRPEGRGEDGGRRSRSRSDPRERRR
nr:apoptotic chromatin condensation inducer in the nucleus [Gasterosteus aculeatus aculeatus]